VREIRAESVKLWLTRGEGDDLGVEAALFIEGEEADGYGQVKAAGAAGAGVEVEDAAFVGDGGDVGVAVEDGGEFCCGGVEVEGAEVVEHIEVVG